MHRWRPKKGLEFTTLIAEDCEFATTDRRSLRQILLNLTNNAIKYTQKGSVRIDVRAATWNARPALTLIVSDTGVGIKPEDQERLFGAFEQFDFSHLGQFDGSGLGLHLCRNLAELLGGDLSVTSRYGEGSTFALTLPRVPREAR